MTTQTLNIETATIPLETIISRNVKVALALRDKNQTDLSRALGVSRATISQKIHGVCSWTIADMEKVGQFLDIAPSRLLDPAGVVSSANLLDNSFICGYLCSPVDGYALTA